MEKSFEDCREESAPVMILNLESHSSTNYLLKHDNFNDESSTSTKNGLEIRETKRSTDDKISRKELLLICEHCDDTFELRDLLHQHYLEKHAAQEVKCHICDETSANKVALSLHMITIHEFHQCDICKNLFANKDLHDHHRRKNHPKYCGYCDASYPTKKLLGQHYLEKHAAQELKCHICDKDWQSLAALKHHMVTKHKFNQCGICRKFFAQKRSLEKHMQTKHRFSCEHCDITFRSKDLLDQHCWNKHSVHDMKCNICNETAVDKSALNAHMDTVHKYVACELCPKFFANKNSLRNHKNTHSLMKFKCEICELTFICQSSVKEHMDEEHRLVNEDDSPDDSIEIENYECETSFEAFNELDENSRQPEMGNNGKLPSKEYGCEMCPKSFTNKKSLKTHKRRAHKLHCEYCDTTVISTKLLDQHYLDKHSKQRVKCHICNETTANKDALDSHMVTIHKFFQCGYCKKLYTNKFSLNGHVRKKHLLHCQHCNTTLATKKMMDQHYLENHSTEEIKCRICHETAANKDALDSHMVTIHNRHQCEICRKLFNDEKSVNKHRRIKHRLSCGHCNICFTTKELLYEHYSEKHPTEKVQCHICNETIVNKTLLNDHLVTVHSFFQCKMCPKFYTNSNSFRSHRFKKHSSQCKVCNLPFFSQLSLKRHMREKHKLANEDDCSDDDNISVDSIEIGKYECNECEEIFDTFHKLEYHKKIHIPRVDFLDDNSTQAATAIDQDRKVHQLDRQHCTETFTSIELFNLHSLEKHVTQEVKCHICNECFPNNTLLDSHMVAMHKPQECEICKKLFDDEKSVNKHIRTAHRLSCEHCKKSFSTRKVLDRHYLEKHPTDNVQCHICNKTIGNKTLLYQHMVTIHKIFQCKICPKFYTNANSLRSHKFQKHSLQCKVCKLPFFSPLSLKRHMREKHKLVHEDDCSDDDNISAHSIEIGKFKCKACKEMFNTFDELKSHEKNHIPRVDYLDDNSTKAATEIDENKLPKVLHCQHCNLAFTSIQLFNLHSLEKHATQEAKCQICNECYPNITLMNSHMVTTHKFFQCKICLKLFNNKISFVDHKRKKHPLSCEHCKISFPSKELLGHHYLENHAAQELKCQICNKTSANKLALSSHMLTVHKLFQCRQCPKYYPSKYSFNSHQSRKHTSKNQTSEYCEQMKVSQKHKLTNEEGSVSDDDNNMSDDNNNMSVDGTSPNKAKDNYFECAICNNFYDNQLMLDNHRHRKHPLACEYCNNTFESGKLLDQHYLEKHADQEVKCEICEEISANKVELDLHMVKIHKFLQCDYCKKFYTNKSSLVGHLRKKHLLQCQHCDTILSTKKLLDQHYLEKHSTEEVKCRICHETSANRDALDCHMVTIHKRHQCEICKRFFANKNSIDKHRSLSHRLTCEHCNFSCTANKRLDQHIMEKHTKEEVQCRICDETIDNKVLLEQHMIKTHTIFQCKMCPRFYNNLSSLRSHNFQKHSSKKKLQCEVCSLKFSSKISLKKHINEKHENHGDSDEEEDDDDFTLTNDDDDNDCSLSNDDDFQLTNNEDFQLINNDDCKDDENMSVDSFEIGKYECNECEGIFDSFHELESHKKIHIPRVDEISIKSSTLKEQIWLLKRHPQPRVRLQDVLKTKFATGAVIDGNQLHQ